jgi:hypothetical protein
MLVTGPNPVALAHIRKFLMRKQQRSCAQLTCAKVRGGKLKQLCRMDHLVNTAAFSNF